jgi:hypothetical protein
MSSAECAPDLSACEVHLGRAMLTLEATNVSCPFDDGNLETKTDTQVWDFLFSSPFGSRDHTLGTSQSETTGNNDTPEISLYLLQRMHMNSLGGTKCSPGIVVSDWVLC